ncbi:MAG: NAD(P)/FAD-dependent oxidoreductase [Anaerolineae bacterium]
MMEKTQVLILGGGPAGLVAAGTARAYYPDKAITLVRDVERALVPCGIPYIFNRLGSVDKNLIPDTGLEAQNVTLLLDSATQLDPEAHVVTFASGRKIEYEKLVLAVGSAPVELPIPGATQAGVYYVKKDPGYLREMHAAVSEAKRIVIIGGGFIGVEFAEEIAHLPGKEVSVVEMLPCCLAQAFDEELCVVGEEELKKLGVKIHTNSKVLQLTGDGQVTGVALADGTELPADLVIFSIGARPNIKLAQEAGLTIGYSGGIWVDEYLRTTAPDIFAVGDCAEKKDFFTRRVTRVMLASTASAEARIAGANLYSLRVVRDNRGTLATFSTRLGEMTIAAAGLTESRAREEGFDVVISHAKTVNRHPGSLPDAKTTQVKLIFSADSLVLLGGQVAGGQEAGELINLVALALQNRMTATQLETLQVATHPLLTPAPTVYPLVTAAMQAIALA